MNQKNILVFTDIGDDIDDSLALTYLLTKTQHDIVGIVTWGPQQAKLQALNELLDILQIDKKPLVLAGSTSSNNNTPPGELEQVIHTLPQTYEILSLGPMTDIATLLKNTQKQPSHITSQGTVKANGTPDDDCYNYKHDMEAASYVLQREIPHSWVDKDLSYKYGIEKDSFEAWSNSGQTGKYLYKQSLFRQEKFKILNPEKYEEIYGHTSVISYPYDLLTAIALDKSTPAGRVKSLAVPDNILFTLHENGK